MNIPATRWILLAACLVAAVAAAGAYDDEYDEEEAPVAPPPSPIKRPSPLRQGRGPLLSSRPSPKNTVTQKTTTTTEAPAEYDDEEIEGEEGVGSEEHDQSTTSEAPKRGGVRAGGVRPFRSNADLLETLKKRREQAGSGHHAAPAPSTTTTQAPSQQEKGFKGNRRPGKPGNSFADQTGSNSDRKSTFNRSNNRRSAQKADAEPAVEQQQPEEPVRPRTFGRNRRL